MVSVSCNILVPCLLVGISLSNCLRVSGNNSIENPDDIFTGKDATRPEVRTPQGRVLGVNMISHYNRIFFGFKGTPFAQPPVGDLRFKAPVPESSWNGILDGSMDSNLCPQLDGNSFIGDEDCLSFNVYTPHSAYHKEINNLTHLMGDYAFTYPSCNGMKPQLVHAKSPQYLCSFEYRGTVSYSYFFTGGSTKNWGVAHADELLYLLPGSESQLGPPGWEFGETDWEMVDTMVQLWTSFAINGIFSTLGPNGTVEWEPYSSSRDNYLQIENGPDPTL